MHHNAHLAGDPRQNKLLAALPDVQWQRLHRDLEPIEMTLGSTLCESGGPLAHGYFPATSIFSLVYATADGASTEVASIGSEGLVGVALVLGGETTPNRIVVQRRGWAYRVTREILAEEFARGGAIQYLLLRYTQALLTLIGQTAVCNRRHSIDQQLCRWLLTNLDRFASQELTMTHELLANMFGVRREGITEAAHKLQISGLITYSRGRITVVDRAGLEAGSCECYSVARREYDRLLGMGFHPPHAASLASAEPQQFSAQRDRVRRTCAPPAAHVTDGNAIRLL
jgi:CRP-like cAMP-binding protein